MEKFVSDLRDEMQTNDMDKTIQDCFDVNSDFICHVIEGYLAKDQTTIIAVKDVELVDVPKMSSVSTHTIIKFEAKVLPNWNVQEERKMVIFVKTPAFVGPVELSVRLCHKEIAIYEELFADLKNFLYHPLKGPYIPPFSEVMYATHNKDTPMLVLPSLTDAGYYCPRDRGLNRTEMKSVLKSLAKFHADGIKFLRENNQDKYTYMKVGKERLAKSKLNPN